MLLFLLASCVFVLPEEREAHLCDAGLADARHGDVDVDGIADCLDVEECDGIDNDGDGAVDEALYPDADGDGYGDPTNTGPCFVGWVATPGDCDDADAGVNPGALFEVCDGKNTLCAADWTEDLDVVTLYDRDPDTTELGAPTDVTDQFMQDEPAAVTLYDGELLHVCPARDGAYEVTIVTATNATSVGIRGIVPGNDCDTASVEELPTLSGAGGETPVILQGSARGVVAAIDCLAITGGGALGTVGGGLIVGPTVTATVSRSAIWGNSGPWFGGVWNRGALTLDEVSIIGNSVQDPADDQGGGGIRSEGTGSLEVIGGRIAGNESAYGGGGATILVGSASFYGTTIGGSDLGAANVAVYRGGALMVGFEANVEIHGVRIVGNQVEYTDGGAIYTEGTVACFADEQGSSEIRANTTGEAGVGGVYMAEGAYFSCGCEYLENEGVEFYLAPADRVIAPLEDAFACDAFGCDVLEC